MSATMGGTHYQTPQTIFQHMMGGQQHAQDNPQWMQMPQVPPISMPWSSLSSNPSNIVIFGEDRQPISNGYRFHQKRKLDAVDLMETRQHKQFITEEKMAAHFRDLRISSNSVAPVEPVPSTSTAFEPTVNTCKKLNIAEDLDMDGPTIVDISSLQNKEGPRLVISEELKKLKDEPILPSSLLSKLERPSMALVLWEPRNKHLRLLPGPRDTPTPIPNESGDDNNNNSTSVIDHNNVNNNNEGVPNLNAMITDIDTPELEPMDL